MTKKINPNPVPGVMSRLVGNEEGNIIALFAASIIPVIGLVGGGVDMSRIYLTHTRLQGACDAGALIGRKMMGVGTWDANDGAAGDKALAMFDSNFVSGAYGSQSLQRSYTESGGNVVGTASAVVPMALMQVLGQEAKVVSVRCQSELRVPNTDVMFVLDTTGSMGDPASGSTESKISGLRKAVKCFYEALAKKNISDISPADCGETSDPSTTNTGAVQLRFGFVPYAINVNVGRLLPHAYLADQWTYQSREATNTTGSTNTPSYGTESAPALISSVDTNLADIDWRNTDRDIVQNGTTYTWWSSVTPADCSSKSVPSSTTGQTVGATTLISQTPYPLVEPAPLLTKTYQQDTRTTTNSYRFNFTGDKNKPSKRAGAYYKSKPPARPTESDHKNDNSGDLVA